MTRFLARRRDEPSVRWNLELFSMILENRLTSSDVAGVERSFRVIKIQCAFLQTVEDRTLRTGAIPG
jgi:hypothetical protein